jgi:hypothetical protein
MPTKNNVVSFVWTFYAKRQEENVAIADTTNVPQHFISITKTPLGRSSIFHNTPEGTVWNAYGTKHRNVLFSVLTAT